jgi:subtilisin-like proprotein convertase family protein
MKIRRLAVAAAGAILAASFPLIANAAEDAKTVGRVRVTTVHNAAAAAAVSINETLAARYAPAAGRRFADQRVISVRPRLDDPSRFDATIFDYAVEKAFDLVLDAKGNELSRKTLPDQPARILAELADAEAIVREHPAFAAALTKAALTLYEPMPAVTVDADGRRLVNVGVVSHAQAGAPIEKNEVVSVDLGSGNVVRYPSGAPPASRAELLACGPPSSGCGYATGPCSGYYQITWPAVDPVWKVKVRHPDCTTSVQGQGTGLELTDVYYKGRLILKRAEVPVLNVKYSGDSCGPYRDWLYSEDCFQAEGTDVPASGSGIRVASAPPSTLCESGTPGSDAGVFKGVAIYDQGDALWLMTETNAGWYRYVMEWRLHLDGTIEPIFGFGATTNSCTCNLHFHHAYWRFEWAIDATSDGTTDDPATGICTLEHRRTGTPDTFDPVTTEGTFVRPTIGSDQDFWRIKNPATGNGYILQPGPLDGNATGDSYGKWDLAALAENSGQIDDPNGDTTINVDPWVSGEALGATKRLVTWYHATYTHDDPNGGGEPCELAGPKFVPLLPCAGSISLDRTAYACGATVNVTMDDRDLAGTGAANVVIASTTESVPEPMTLAENPVGSGHFQGAIPTSSGAPAGGDGKISVTNGDTLDVRYIDASSCGTPNVAVDKTAAIDCLLPAIGNVHAVPAANLATITWDTNEPAGGVVHFGTTLPTASTVATTGTSTTHTATLTGLAECTTYYYWIESADAAGNVAFSNAGGGTYAFTTAQSHQVNVTSTDTPVAIPDANPTGATSTIAIADTAIVQDVNVKVNITHTYDNDLTLSLITPQNTSIALSDRRGGSSDNFRNTVFDDEATTPIASGSAPFTGSFKPEGLLSVADGVSGAGNWKFKVVDSAGADVGTIDNWTLTLVSPALTCAPVGAPPPVPDGSFGSGMTVSRVTGAASAVHLAWDTQTCASKNNHLLYGTLQNVSTYLLDGAVCGLGPAGGYDWAGIPAGDLWFVVVGDDAASVEGTWGTDSTGAHRSGTTPSGYCGFTARNNTATCP